MEDRDTKSILDVLSLTQELLALADRGEMDAEDDRCRILFTLVRDCAFRIQAEAEREMRRHMAGKLEKKGDREEGKEALQEGTRERD